MDYGEQDNGASGSVPECGAIFMSNIQTKKECLKRNVFALPPSHAEFVTRIKAGMVLFLFEFRKRKLYGVYQAISDGAMDIVPHAFNYSGQRFPAQVCFRQIWHCDPISEKEFQDAIIENYFSAKKFNFGLSGDQVRRLLYMFSSRKMTNKMPPQPRSKAIVEVAVKDRRLVGDDRHELSERGYMEPTEYDEHVSSFARGREDDVLVDNRVNAEGKVCPFPQDDFLTKRRRIGKEGRFAIDNVAENGHFYQRTFCTDSPKDSLDEVRTLANASRFMAVQMANEDQVNGIQNPVQSSEHFLEPLDGRAHGDYTSMQWSTLPDDCQQTSASDHYGNPVGQSEHEIDDDRFLLDDCVKRDCNINSFKYVANNDDYLNLCREAREIVKDQEWLMNRELEIRRQLDCDDSSMSAFDPSSSFLHKISKTTPAGRFEIDENEPNFGTCFVEGYSSKNVLHPWHRGYRIIEGRKYPIVEGRSTENMVDNVPPIMATSGGYFANADRQTLDNARFRNRERVDKEEASHTHTNPGTSMRYPSFPQLERNLSSFSDKFPEKQLSHLTVSRNVGLLRSTFNDATIIRTVPYLPDHPNLSHGCSVSKEANQNSTSIQKNHPHDGSFGNFYPLSSNRLQQNSLKSEKSSQPLDIRLEFGDNGFEMRTSGLGNSLLLESSDSLINPNFSTDMNLNTSAPANYRGSLSSKFSPSCTDLENFEGKKGLLPYYSKSRDHHFSFDGNLPEASESLSKHVPQHGMAMSAGKDFSRTESKDLGMDICLLETDLAMYENHYSRFSSNTNLRELHKISGANSTFNRRSVFSRLSSKESSQFGGERNAIDVNHQDCYTDATADEVMEMLKQDDNLSPIKLSKSRVVGQPRESAVRKKTQFHMETDHSTMEKKRLSDASQATADSMDEVPKETRTLDFKCRSERKKNLGQIGADSASHSNPTGANEEVSEKKTQFHMETDHSTMEKKRLNIAIQATVDSMDEIPKETRTLDFKRRSERKNNLGQVGADSASHSNPTGANKEVKSPINSTLRRKKLVRPVFSKTDTASDATRGNETLPTPAPILDKDDKQSSEAATSICESEIPNYSTTSINVLASHTRQEMDCNKESPFPEEQKDVAAHVSPSTCINLKGHEHGNGDLHISSSEVLKETSQQKICDIQTSVDGVLVKDTDVTINVLASHTRQEMGCNKGPLYPEEQKDVVAHVSLSMRLDLEGHEHGNGDLHISSSEVPMETSQQKIYDIQTSVEGVLAKDTDATITCLNMLEPSFDLDAGCRNNLTEEKHLKKMKIILTSKKDMKASSQ